MPNCGRSAILMANKEEAQSSALYGKLVAVADRNDLGLGDVVRRIFMRSDPDWWASSQVTCSGQQRRGAMMVSRAF
jgi:hypothetical protein